MRAAPDDHETAEVPAAQVLERDHEVRFTFRFRTTITIAGKRADNPSRHGGRAAAILRNALQPFDLTSRRPPLSRRNRCARPFNPRDLREQGIGMAKVDGLLVQAAEHYNAGRPQPANALCTDILRAQPNHLPALHLAAVIALAEGRMEDGREWLGQVFRLDPDHVPALATLGDALAVKGEHEGAMAAF